MAPHPSGIPPAGVVIDVVSDVAGTIIVLTGLLAAGLRTVAVLTKSSPERAEWLTAIGFLSGVMCAAVLLALDVVMG